MIVRALLGLGLAALLATPASAANPRVCTVEAVEGDAARAWSAGSWAPLGPGAAVGLETKVATGPETRVKIACENGLVLTIGAATEVNLETLVTPGDDVILQLIEGIVGLFVPAGSGVLEVRTSVAIASVRSTEWLVEHDRAEGSAVFVRAGRVAVRSSAGGRFGLGPGEGISIGLDGTPGPVKAWGPPRIRRSTAALGFDWR